MDLNKIMSGLSSSGVLGGLAGGAVSGALMSNKKIRKHTGTALKVGGIAALGGLAWKAYQGYQNQQPAAASQSEPQQKQWHALQESDFRLEPEDTGPQSRALLLVQAMIADSWIDIEQFRLLVLRTAWRIDQLKEAAILGNPLPGKAKSVKSPSTALF